MDPQTLPTQTTRRSVLGLLAGIGVSSAGLSRALAVEAERGGIDAAAIARAEWVSGVTLDDEQREKLARSVSQQVEQLERIRKVEIDADVPPATQFASHRDAYASAPRYAPDEGPGSVTLADVPADQFPRNKVELAFAPIRVLAAMLRQREVSSWELTELFLDRLDRHGKTLNCVVTLTEDLARRQARIADRELAAGRPRGPLHGIPWGAKDLIAVAGYPTTWGCEIFREQQRADTATVARRLEAAGAVLIAKLSLGAIAMGDNWFGGKTLNPWNLEQGSSGSSAGSAAATAAGLVPFSLGSETLGSIVSPARRCGATGLRPTFGRVSRHGCMPLAWSFDKIGPICRSVEDTAYVFAAIHGADGLDPTAVTHPFQWPAAVDLSQLRVGYTGEASDDREELRILREMGVQLKPIELPEDYPTWPLASMLEVESASMFYDVWKDGTEEGLFRWARIWQTAGFVPAIDYVRAMRVRTMLMQAMEEAIAGVDCYFGGNDLVLTNLTGHPTVVMPYRRPASGEAPDGAAVSGENDNNPQQQAGQDLPVEPGPRPPRAITFTGQLHGESRLLAVADAFQRAKGDHRLHPPTFTQP